MTIAIRGMTKPDFDRIVAVQDAWWGGPGGERTHHVFFYELGESALVAEEDGELIGFLLGFVTPSAPKTGFVYLVGIAPEYRRRGVGKMLYETFTEHCRARGAERMKATTTPGNEGSVRFHTALGFSHEHDPNYAGEGRARVVFRKQLAGN